MVGYVHPAVRRAPLVLSLVILPALLAYAGCYDWDVREASSAADVTTRDRETPDTLNLDDAPADGDGGTLPEASPSECEVLRAAITTTLTDARKCFFAGNECLTTVLDECGCQRFVARPDAAATSKYADAVDRFNKAGCIPSNCPGTCLKTSGCLLTDASATQAFCFFN